MKNIQKLTTANQMWSLKTLNSALTIFALIPQIHFVFLELSEMFLATKEAFYSLDPLLWELEDSQDIGQEIILPPGTIWNGPYKEFWNLVSLDSLL